MLRIWIRAWDWYPHAGPECTHKTPRRRPSRRLSKPNDGSNIVRVAVENPTLPRLSSPHPTSAVDQCIDREAARVNFPRCTSSALGTNPTQHFGTWPTSTLFWTAQLRCRLAPTPAPRKDISRSDGSWRQNSHPTAAWFNCSCTSSGSTAPQLHGSQTCTLRRAPRFQCRAMATRRLLCSNLRLVHRLSSRTSKDRLIMMALLKLSVDGFALSSS